MEKLQVITHPQFGKLSVTVVNGMEMFKARDCALMLGYKNINDAISRHCKGVVKHDLPTKSGVQTVNLIPESDVWRLIIRSKLPQAEAIERWIMEEVLPSIRKTGKYEQMSFQPAPSKRLPKKTEYVYFDKTFDGVPVLTTEDVEHMTGIKPSTTGWYIRKYMQKSADFYLLEKGDLMRYKQQNPRANKGSSVLLLVTRSGFVKLCQTYGVQIEQPKCFEEPKTFDISKDFTIRKLIDKLKNKYGYKIELRCLTQDLADDYTDGVITNRSVTVLQNGVYYILVDEKAPIPNQRFLLAQGLACIVSGQLRKDILECKKNQSCYIMDYSDQINILAGVLTAFTLFCDN